MDSENGVAEEVSTDVPANVDEVSSRHDVSDMLQGDLFGDDSEEEVVEEAEGEAAEDEGADLDDAEGVEETLTEAPEKSEADALREQLVNLSAILTQHGINPAEVMQRSEEASRPAEVTPPVTQQPSQYTSQQGMQLELTPLELTQEEFDAAFEKPEALAGLLNKVRESAVEQVLRSVPTLAANIVNQQTVLKGLVQDFYSANQDLAGVKPFVAVVANEIAARNPSWSVEQVFQEAAKESRSRLQMKQQAVENAAPVGGRRPGLPVRKVGARKPNAPKLSKLEQELNDLM